MLQFNKTKRLWIFLIPKIFKWYSNFHFLKDLSRAVLLLIWLLWKIEVRWKIRVQERNFQCFFSLKYLLRTPAISSVLKLQLWPLELAGIWAPGAAGPAASPGFGISGTTNSQELPQPMSITLCLSRVHESAQNGI